LSSVLAVAISDYCTFALGMCEDAGKRAMPRKRKKKRFSAVKVVREMARERVGSPKPSQLVPGKKKKPEKHKPTLGELLAEE
jgi:hypothetical protein